MKNDSPFTLRRFEYERTHLYYLPVEIFRVLEGRKSVFLIGSRGTGKTTLLTALKWEEQRKNSNLAEVLRKIDADKSYIGLYIKMPSTLASVFDRWLPNMPSELRASIFSLYIDLIWLQSLLESISQMLIDKQLDAAPSKEQKRAQTILDRYPELINDTKLKAPFSFKRFASLVYEKRRTLEKWALAGVEPDTKELHTLFPLGQIGQLGQAIASDLAQFCEQYDKARRQWHFKICLDESECLSTFQRRTLHTVVRLVATPVSYVVSYVREMEDMTSTFIKGMSLQDADRELIQLDSMDDKVFSELAEGVATVRIQNILGDTAQKFDTKGLLGALDINELLLGILQASAAPEAKRILTLAEQLSRSEFYADITGDHGAPPIYQAYIIDRLQLELPAPNSEHWERRKQNSAEIRKRMVAAYLCLCKDLKTRPKYASADMLLQMSDKCIRDYLNQMDSIFTEVDVPLPDFCERRVPIDTQNVALYKASTRKKEALPGSEVGSPIETGRLIDGLGSLTARLQTSENKSLRSSEKGRFVVDTSLKSQRSDDAIRLIKEASEAGFLKAEPMTDRFLRFRMHCSLAAAYGFSYRGAYYDSPLEIEDLVMIYQQPDSEVRGKLVVVLGDKLLQEPPSLFGGEA
jgi:hypothetical protein